MEKEINLQDYEIILMSQEEACAKAVELLGLDSASSGQEVKDYIGSHHEWHSYDIEWKYMGYDCGDCYMGGYDYKGMVCGGFLVVYAWSPVYKLVQIYKKKQ